MTLITGVMLPSQRVLPQQIQEVSEEFQMFGCKIG